MKYLPRVLRYLWPYRGLASISVVLTVLASLVGLLAPWPLKIVVDNVLGSHPFPPALAMVASWFGGESSACSSR